MSSSNNNWSPFPIFYFTASLCVSNVKLSKKHSFKDSQFTSEVMVIPRWLWPCQGSWKTVFCWKTTGHISFSFHTFLSHLFFWYWSVCVCVYTRGTEKCLCHPGKYRSDETYPLINLIISDQKPKSWWL